MNTQIHWGNISEIDSKKMSYIQTLVDKTLNKLKRLIAKFDSSNVRLEIYLKEIPSSGRKFRVVVNFVTPKSTYHITERGFELETTIHDAINVLRRKFRKDKERKISLHRQHTHKFDLADINIA